MGDAAAPSADLLQADLFIEYPFNRTTGPVIGAFYTALRDQAIIGIRGEDGRVVCPPYEYDPTTGAPLTELVPVSDEGVITSWSWVDRVREQQGLADPHALALVQLDGADTAILHRVAASGPDAVSTGARVKARWADEREGAMTDIVCFDLIASNAGESA